MRDGARRPSLDTRHSTLETSPDFGLSTLRSVAGQAEPSSGMIPSNDALARFGAASEDGWTLDFGLIFCS